jgi:hypothetical protein
LADNVQVSCIVKRNGNYNPHERIETLGGVHNGKRWSLPEQDIIAELEKSDSIRRWNFYTDVSGNKARVVIAIHSGRKYLKTEPDRHPDNNLLNLPKCP